MGVCGHTPGAATRGAAMAAAVMAAVFVVAGCGAGADSSDSGSDRERPQSTTQRSASQPAPTLPEAKAPAAEAGGICGKLSYEQIQGELGIDFDVAALHRSDNQAQSCTYRSTTAPLPDLTLAFVPGELDDEAFDERIKPDGGKEVTGLGSSAYAVARDGNADTGPVCEVGWFNDSGSYSLVLTTRAQTSDQEAAAQLAQLVELGKLVK